MCQLCELDGCTANFFADSTGHAGKLAFTVGARLLVKKALLVGISCRQCGTITNGLHAGEEFVGTVLYWHAGIDKINGEVTAN